MPLPLQEEDIPQEGEGEKEEFPDQQLNEEYPEDYADVCRAAFQLGIPFCSYGDRSRSDFVFSVDELIEEPLDEGVWSEVTTLSGVSLYKRTVRYINMN